jgi:hypothetical protein
VNLSNLHKKGPEHAIITNWHVSRGNARKVSFKAKEGSGHVSGDHINHNGFEKTLLECHVEYPGNEKNDFCVLVPHTENKDRPRPDHHWWKMPANGGDLPTLRENVVIRSHPQGFIQKETEGILVKIKKAELQMQCSDGRMLKIFEKDNDNGLNAGIPGDTHGPRKSFTDLVIHTRKEPNSVDYLYDILVAPGSSGSPIFYNQTPIGIIHSGTTSGQFLVRPENLKFDNEKSEWVVQYPARRWFNDYDFTPYTKRALPEEAFGVSFTHIARELKNYNWKSNKK